MPAEVNLKETMEILFQFQRSDFCQLSFSSSGVHGLLVIHNRLFDQQNKTPAIDLSFCFFEVPFPYQVALQFVWWKMTPDELLTITVNEEEYELLKKVFHHFARRTITTTTKPYGHMPLIIKHKIDHYFTRAVVYPLYTDPDVLAKGRNSCTSQSATLPDVSVPQVPCIPTASVTRSQEKLEANSTKSGKGRCSYCDTRSDALKKCSRCGESQYCGRTCQRKHWKEHKSICNPQSKVNRSVPADNLPSASNIAPNKQNKCEGCEKEFSTLRKCRCHQVAYCSVECQRKDWQKHKDVCSAKKQA